MSGRRSFCVSERPPKLPVPPKGPAPGAVAQTGGAGGGYQGGAPGVGSCPKAAEAWIKRRIWRMVALLAMRASLHLNQFELSNASLPAKTLSYDLWDSPVP